MIMDFSQNQIFDFKKNKKEGQRGGNKGESERGVWEVMREEKEREIDRKEIVSGSEMVIKDVREGKRRMWERVKGECERG
jgi:hypothetical protein